jgi:hypothetical protein
MRPSKKKINFFFVVDEKERHMFDSASTRFDGYCVDRIGLIDRISDLDSAESTGCANTGQ